MKNKKHKWLVRSHYPNGMFGDISFVTREKARKWVRGQKSLEYNYHIKFELYKITTYEKVGAEILWKTR